MPPKATRNRKKTPQVETPQVEVERVLTDDANVGIADAMDVIECMDVEAAVPSDAMLVTEIAEIAEIAESVPEPIQHITTSQEPIVLQLPITSARMDELLYNDDMASILTYKPTVTDPIPYCPHNRFTSENDVLLEDTSQHVIAKDDTEHNSSQHAAASTGETASHHETKCFWCCHNMVDVEYGMPIRYDAVHKSFAVFGSFCSLECAAAYNYSVHMGSNRSWEIHSWIQFLGKKFGLKTPIRPAPSRYLLKMFNGNLNINEFRNVHKSPAQTCVLNIPPFVHIASQMELINTSFLDREKGKGLNINLKDELKNKENHSKADTIVNGLSKQPVVPREETTNSCGKRYPKTSITSTLEKKMNLQFE